MLCRKRSHPGALTRRATVHSRSSRRHMRSASASILMNSSRRGWREQIERAWRAGATRVSYRYVWNFLPDGREGTVFWPDKVHARHGYQWRNPVHEILQRVDGRQEVIVPAQNVTLEHHADPAKSRGQYLGLLELSRTGKSA